MKKLVKLLLVVVALLCIGAVILLLNLNRAAKAAVETGGNMVLGVPTTLEKASVSVTDGSFGLDGLVLGSPDGFKAEEIFRLGHGHVEVKLASLLGDEIVVREVVIDGAEITIEMSGGRINWDVIMEGLKGEPSEEEKEELSKNIRLDRLVFTNGRIKIEGMPVSVPLPTVEIKDIRTAEGTGVTVRNVLVQVVESLRKEVFAAVAKASDLKALGELPGELASALMKGDIEGGKEALESGKDLLEAGKGALEGAEGTLKDTLGGIFGSKDGKGEDEGGE